MLLNWRWDELVKKKQVTSRDIAQQLGISQSTVSRALSENPKESALVTEKTRKRVEQTAAEMNYRPNLMARGISTGRTYSLGLLTYHIAIEMFGNQTGQLLKVTESHNYQIQLGIASDWLPMTPLDDQTKQINQLISRGIDGLFINTWGDEGEAERVLDAVEGRVPVVTYVYPIKGLSGVVLDQVSGYYEATAHLIRLGHERIGFVGPKWDEASPTSVKAKGYLMAMQKFGLSHEFIHSRGMQTEGGYIQAKEFGDRFTALVCRCDYTAIGICRALRELGVRTPEDVAVVGNGDIDVAAYMNPALTTLTIPSEAIAQAAMELMLEKLEGQETPRQVTLKPSLIVRESCGANSPN